MTTVAEKVAEKMGKPDGMPTDVFFKNNKILHLRINFYHS